MSDKEKLPSAHVKFSKEIIQKVYGPKLKVLLGGLNPPTNVSQLATSFQETYKVGTSPSTIAEWLKVMGLAPKTRVDWGDGARNEGKPAENA